MILVLNSVFENLPHAKEDKTYKNIEIQRNALATKGWRCSYFLLIKIYVYIQNNNFLGKHAHYAVQFYEHIFQILMGS